MIKKIAYPKWWNEFWNEALELKTRSLGSKSDAWEKAKKLKMDARDVPMVLEAFKKHTDLTRNYWNGGPFYENHKDMSGWLAQRRWEQDDEDYESIGIAGKRLSDADRKKREAAQNFLDRHHA